MHLVAIRSFRPTRSTLNTSGSVGELVGTRSIVSNALTFHIVAEVPPFPQYRTLHLMRGSTATGLSQQEKSSMGLAVAF